MKRQHDLYRANAQAAEGRSPGAGLVENLHLVKRIASHFRGRLPPSIEPEDLIQAGTVGLLEALAGFDAERNSDFEAYAKPRIRGAMLDEIRRAAWAPRSTVKLATESRAAEQRIANRTGAPVTHREIAEEMGMPIERYHKLRGRNQGVVSGELTEQLDVASSTPEAEQLLEEADALRALQQAIEALNERERLVIELYYHEELTLKEIGAVISVSESRVSQILTAVAGKLRAAMQG